MRFSPIETERRTRNAEFIKAQASLDAFDYIILMKEKSPESLVLEPDGRLFLNMIDGRKIFDGARKNLNLTPEEAQEYAADMETAVRRILGK